MEYWKYVDGEGNTIGVESHSYSHIVPGAIQITKEEYDAFIASLPLPPPPPEPSPNYTHPKFTRITATEFYRIGHIEDFLESL